MPCAAAADFNNDSLLDVSDAISLLNFLFGGGSEAPEIAAPVEEPGWLHDHATPLDCDVSIEFVEIIPLDE